LQPLDVREPESLIVRDPIDEGAEPFRLDAVVGEPAFLSCRHEAGGAQHGQVLRDGRLGNVELGRQVADGCLPQGELLEDRAAARIAEDTEDLVFTLHEQSISSHLLIVKDSFRRASLWHKVASQDPVDFRVDRYRFGDEPTDAAIVALLERVFVGEGYTPAKAGGVFDAESLRRRGDAWIAVSGNDVAGIIFLVEPQDPSRQIAIDGEFEVHLLAVAPNHRGAGVGRALLEALSAEARTRGAGSIVLSTQPSMRAAHRLYSEAGFRRAPERDWKRPDGREYWAFVKALPKE